LVGTLVERCTTTRADLNEQLAALALAKRTFDVVVLVGHGSRDGMRIAHAEGVTSWSAISGYLRPFKPRRLVLVTCEGGVSPAANALFDGLRDLRRIYATPSFASRKLGSLLFALAPLLVVEKAPSKTTVLAVKAALFTLTGEELRQWLRSRDHGNPDGLIVDALSRAAAPLVKELWRRVGKRAAA
jgi:hypothetical protein